MAIMQQEKLADQGKAVQSVPQTAANEPVPEPAQKVAVSADQTPTQTDPNPKP